MQHEVLDRVRELGPYLREQADATEQAGRMSDETAKRLKETGVVRLLQPKRHGGYEADPRVFFEAVMEVARHCGASGWVSGIIGVHPWELGICDERAQAEVWGDDPDTWMSSTYMPGGRARRVPGGYELTGRWSFSSGCDVSDWIFLGGIAVDDDGPTSDDMSVLLADPTRYLHLLLPRADFTIVDGTWDVVGLCGTGSKDVVVEGAFVPDHRTITAMAVVLGDAPGITADSAPTFRMPWSAIFPNAITAAIIGIAEGALDAAAAYQRPRSSMAAGPILNAPVTMTAIGEAASEIAACRAQLLGNIERHWEHALRGEPSPLELRSETRRDQVQGSWRATRAVDNLFDNAGGGALRKGEPLQRLWRDAHAGLHHVINSREKTFHSAASVAMGSHPLEAIL